MNPRSYLLMSVVLCAAMSTLADTASTKVTKSKTSKQVTAKPKAAESSTITLTTGTFIPDKVRLAGDITDGPNVVQVYSSETIRRSGAADLAAFLRSRGAR